MLVLEIKTNFFLYFWRGTRTLVPRHQNSGAPTFFWGLFPLLWACLCWQCSDKIRKYQGHIETFKKKRENQIPYAGSWDLNKKTVGILEEAPEFWCLGTRTLVPLYFWVWISCWWTLIHAGSVILRTGNVKNLYLNLWRRQILISRAFYWLEIWNL